ncbi:potassium channel subfamily K member 15-like [Hydractinia symbiolongicarpus]|uniref:potassium channel subfamily K member 15-like n=1 Tax=Hydractinia symbiolongicarpus TaxID=13093 RepID=UPI00254C380B|nr:potassium channel subfamily K member 15-like [Hydractinia symbiolongicarpus]
MYKTVQLLLVIVHRTILLAVTLVAGTLIFAEIEHINYESAGFFCWTVVTTIGYGNITPKKNWGKIFTMIYGIIGIPITMFCLVSYGSFLNHCIKKFIVATERCCCTNKQVAYLHFKLFIALFLLSVGELFLGGYAMYEMNEWSFLDSVYTWFVSISTIGFGDFVPSYPPEKNLVNSLVSVVIQLFCMVTFASFIEAIQGMIESVNNNSRGVWSIIFCCYKDEEKECYEIQRDSNSSFGLNYVKD